MFFQIQRLASIGARQIALNSAERSLWIAFYIETKDKIYIIFQFNTQEY
ncbi:hypothetical protein LEP1GSC059_1449 [Leptospira noguchii serovar Panama str. CZ214]|uniref:Uncharacterized protein n=1 Tax=Leptospira noguchii serovar Panama str. CZ214 TaxID=1001595 RepID=T0H0R9_9LEPT|nr:hypothetical protein LEP1GSC059_1449 [Leptospira noguchii serovar Panama str. CZ214]